MINISKETTYLTEPLRTDGWIDFAAVLNEPRMEGVTPENNSAVPFWQAVGPQPIARERRPKFFALLGIEPLSEEGNYFVPFSGFLARKSGSESIDYANLAPAELAAFKESSIAHTRPWARAEFPVLAEWIDLNEKPLATLRRVGHCSRFFEPIVVGENGSLYDGYAEFDSKIMRREAAGLLGLCCMLSFGEGRVDDALQDLTAHRQLVRIEASRPFGIDLETSRGREKGACFGIVKFLHHASLTRSQLRTFRERFLAIHELPPVESYFLGERLLAIDSVREESRGRFKDVAMPPMTTYKLLYGDNAAVEASKALFKRDLLADPRIDWNIVLRILNSKFDEAITVCREPDQLLKASSSDRFPWDATAASENHFENPSSTQLAALDSRAFSEMVAGILVNPSIAEYVWTDLECATTVQMTTFAFALAEYHADHAAYPRSLSELEPVYLSIIPKEPISGLDYIYRMQGNGYLLCSVARKGMDENGMFQLDEYYTGDLAEYLSETDPHRQRGRIETRVQGSNL